jgi:4-oxalocrotonate tautomerase
MMALVRVDFSQTQAEAFAACVSEVIDQCMQDVLSVPAAENFIVCQSHSADSLWHALSICPEHRKGQIVLIQITLNQGRSPELKQTFFEKLNQALVAATRVKSEDVFINLVEVARENWSFGMTYDRG